MISISEKEKCCGCYACANACPLHCILMESDADGFWYPVVKEETCIHCGLCETVCPILHPVQTENIPSAYGAQTTDEEILLNSSSGGVFSELAQAVIRKNGVVFGAAFDADFLVQHIYVDSVDMLKKLRGSKYVQSRIGEAYRTAQEFLDQGKLVLFTGTPCQISGLYAFLGGDRENLITQDIICHGVPSPMVWQKYVALREKTAASTAVRMFFRHKCYGWKTYAVLFEFANNTAYVRRHGEDPFMRAFLMDICLRPSCYQCAFKTAVRPSDITLADFWRVDRVLGQMDDDRGTSLVIVNSPKGLDLFEQLQTRLTWQGVSFTESIRYNTAMTISVKEHPQRDAFLHCVRTEGFDAAAKRYLRRPLDQRVKSCIRRVWRRLRRR